MRAQDASRRVGGPGGTTRSACRAFVESPYSQAVKLQMSCALATVLLAVLAGAPTAFATDSAHVSGYYPALADPQDLVFGVHGYVKVTGHIDDGPPGAHGLELGARAFDNSSGSATCPGSEPAFSGGQLENTNAVGNDFDVQLYSGTITLARRVLMCFYFHHKDNSVTQSSETINLRDPVDNVSVTAPASVPAAKAGESSFALLTVTGESDHQYAGAIRIQPASAACGTNAADTSTLPAGAPSVSGDIANPGDLRSYPKFYAALNPPGINQNLGPISATPGTYRICSWLPASGAAAFASSSTFTITASSGGTPPPAAPTFAFTAKSKVKVSRGKFSAGIATCAGACSITSTAKIGKTKVASATGTLPAAGTLALRLKLTKAAAKRLKHARRHRLSVKVSVVVTPAGGAPITKTKTLLLTR